MAEELTHKCQHGCVIHVIPGQKNPKLILNNYDYYCKKKTGKRTIWWCTYHYRTQCKAKLTTRGTVIEIINDHNHEANPGEFCHKKALYSQNMTFKKIHSVDRITWR